MRRAAALWAPVAVWTALLLVGSTRPASDIPGGIPDWLTHGFVYLVLGGLASRALAGGVGRPLTDAAAASVVVLAVVVGVADELRQSRSPGRHPSVGDVGKDAFGATLAAVAWRSRHRREEEGP